MLFRPRAWVVYLVVTVFFTGLYLFFQRAPVISPGKSVSRQVPQQSVTFAAWLERNAPDGGRLSGSDLQEGIRLARERMPRLQALIRKNPEEALSSSLTRSQWEQLPAAIRPFVEVPFRSLADVELFIGCSSSRTRIDHFTTLPDGTRFLTFTTPGTRFNRTRDNVAVEGIHLGGVGALWNAVEPDPHPFGKEPAFGEPVAATTSVRDMYVILVDFDDLPGQPADPSLLEGRINGIVAPQIEEMSSHLSSVSAVVNPKTYRMPQDTGYYLPNQTFLEIWDHAYDMVTNPVTGDGIDLSGYETICVYFAKIPSITFDGYASLPGEKLWLNGSTSARVITHELGHNYGSYHAHSWNVTGMDPVDPGGSHDEYGDPLDIMGSGQLPLGHFHVQNQLQVGWLGTDNFVDVTSSGTYRLYRGDHPLTSSTNAQLRGLRLPKSADNHYWLGYRQLYETYEAYGRGLYMLWQQPNPQNYPKSHLLDLTPGSDAGVFDKFDGGLAMGRTYSDTDAGLHVTPVRRGGIAPDEWMDVVVNMGDFTGNAAPAVSMAGPASGVARETLIFEIEGTDPNGDELAWSWDVGDGLIKANEPVLAHAWLVGGNHTIRCTVTDMKGATTTVEKSVTVDEPLDTWTDSQTVMDSIPPNLYDIAQGGGKAVAVGTYGFAAVTEDGSTWTTGYVRGGISPNLSLEGITHDGSQFVAVGRDFIDSAWEGAIFTSPDGLSWTERYTGGPWLKDVAAGKGLLLAVGLSDTILYSSDGGLSWNPVGGLSHGNFHGISFMDPWFVTVGNKYPGSGPLVLVFGSDLGFYDTSGQTGGVILSDIQACQDILLAGGAGAGIRRSENGGFSFLESDPGGYTIPAFAHGNGVYFAAGTYAGVDLNLVSKDGIEWVSLATDSQPDRNAAVFFKDHFITVGQTGSVWRSPLVNPASSGWGAWYYINLSRLGLNRDPGDDADGDGADNVLEYAVGTDADDLSSVPVTSSSVDPSGYLQITIPRTRAAGDIEYVVEQATGLDDPFAWSSVATFPVSESDTELVVRTTQPLGELSPQFLRLRVRLSPDTP